MLPCKNRHNTLSLSGEHIEQQSYLSAQLVGLKRSAEGGTGGKARHNDDNDADGCQIAHEEAVHLFQAEGLAIHLNLTDRIFRLPSPADKQAGTESANRNH